MDRHKIREKAMTCLYQVLVVEADPKTLIDETFPSEEDASFARPLILNAIEKQDEYAGYIDQCLDHWTYDRLGYIEKAILLLACAEFDTKEISAPIIMDEAIELAKTYGDEDAYKLVNGVLDRI